MTIYLIWFALSVDGRWTSHVTTMANIEACRALLSEQPVSYCVEARSKPE